MRLTAVPALIFAVVACSPPSEAIPAPSTQIPQDPALISRFTDVIWPTILTYRNYGQGDPQSTGPNEYRDKFNSVIDGESSDAFAVKGEAHDIGEVLDASGVAKGETDHLALASATVSELSGNDSKVVACYTYNFTARSEWPHTNDHAVPGASEVTFTLHKRNDWLVREISNNHVVPACQSSKA